jgi:hypothetical protein
MSDNPLPPSADTVPASTADKPPLSLEERLAPLEERLASLEKRQDKDDTDKLHERRIKNAGLLISLASLLVALSSGFISYFNYRTAKGQASLSQPDIRVAFEEGFYYEDVVHDGSRGTTNVGKIAFRVANYRNPVTVERVELEVARQTVGVSRITCTVLFDAKTVAAANAVQPTPTIQYGKSFFGENSKYYGVLNSPPLPFKLEQNEGIQLSTPIWVKYETGTVSVTLTTGDTFTFPVPPPEKRILLSR